MSVDESLACLPKILEEIQGLKLELAELKKASARQINGRPEWEYFRLDEALPLIGITKAAWRRTWKNRREPNGDRVIPHATYSSCTWILKADLKKFIDKRKLK